LTNRDIFDFFRPCGRIREAKLVIDKVTKRHKGVAYVEFFEIDSVEKATSMSNQKLLGIPIIIQTAESEKNRLAEQGIQLELNRPPPQVITNKLYVGNLAPNLNEDDLRRLFEPYGGLDYVNLHVDANTGKSKGFALIQYRTTYDARQAINNMNEKEIQGRKIKVGPITDREKKKASTLEDDEDVKISNNSLARMELMAKLSRDEVRTSTSRDSSKKPEAPKMETCCIVLKNMFVAEE
jgi:RNA-binding protein 39